jgi:hypothetical protein
MPFGLSQMTGVWVVPDDWMPFGLSRMTGCPPFRLAPGDNLPPRQPRRQIRPGEGITSRVHNLLSRQPRRPIWPRHCLQVSYNICLRDRLRCQIRPRHCLPAPQFDPETSSEANWTKALPPDSTICLRDSLGGKLGQGIASRYHNLPPRQPPRRIRPRHCLQAKALPPGQGTETVPAVLRACVPTGPKPWTPPSLEVVFFAQSLFGSEQ